MKKINSIKKAFLHFWLLACLLTGLTLSSCVKDDLLDLDDPSALDDEKAWTTDYLTKLGMNGVYAGLRLGMQSTNVAPIGYELYQFDRFAGGQDRNINALLSGTATPSAGLFSSFFKDMYEGIYRANAAILNIPVKSESSEEDKACYIAEAKFLRAYFYFRLNQVFKGVPIYEEPVIIQDAIRPRSTEAKVWELIIRDLTDCIKEENLPNKYTEKKDFGRVTKGAAYALRGKAYMYTQQYGEAIKDFEEVEKCGYNLFQGGYKQLFKEANENCDEMIFSIQNIAMLNYGSTIQLFCGNRSSQGSCWNNYMVSPLVVDKYENIDGTPFNWEDVLPGYTKMKPEDREVFFLRDTADLAIKLKEAGFKYEKEQDLHTEARAIGQLVLDRLNAIAKNGNGAEKLYLPDGNEARVRKAYENRDPRLNANVITPYDTYKGTRGNTPVDVVMRWPFRSDADGIQDLNSDLKTQYLYFHRKFVSEGFGELQDRMYVAIDHPIIRFADVLLMKAEALNELGRLGDAVKEVNRVRERAGIAPLNSSPATMVSNKEELTKRIRNERWVEFLNEGITYFDELRWETWKKSVFEEGKGSQQVWGSIIRPYTWPDDDRKGYTWPMPQAEIDYNPNLEQTPGWD